MYSRPCQRRKCCHVLALSVVLCMFIPRSAKNPKKPVLHYVSHIAMWWCHLTNLQKSSQQDAFSPLHPKAGKHMVAAAVKTFHNYLCARTLCFGLIPGQRTDRQQRYNLGCGSLPTDSSEVPHWNPAGDQMREDLWSQTVNCNMISIRALPLQVISVGIGEKVTGKNIVMCCNSAVTNQAMKLKRYFYFLRTFWVNLKEKYVYMNTYISLSTDRLLTLF